MSNTPNNLGIPLRNVASPFHSTSASNASTSSAAPPSAVYATLTPEETASRLNTTLSHGLSSSRDAVDRRNIHGANELTKAEEESIYVKFFKQFIESPLILLLLGSAAVSFLMHNYDDAISITLAVVIVVSVGFVQEYRSEKSLEALNKLVPHYAHLIRGREAAAEVAAGRKPHSSTVMAGQLVPGDLVTFTTGDRIPADVRITQATELEIDESNLTGENEPVQKSVQAVGNNATLVDIPVSDRTCIAFMGTLVRHGNGQGIVIATGPKTEFGTISAMLADIETPRTPLQASMDNLGKELSYASFVVIGLIMLVGLYQGRSWLDMFQIGVSLAVAAIPEGLPIIVTVTLALGVLRMVNRGGIVRKLPSVETLGCVSVVCSDKTGTLTMNHMTVTHVWTCGMDAPVEKKSLIDTRPDPAFRDLIKIGNICNNARVSATNTSAAAAAVGLSATSSSATSRFVGQPTDVALLDLVDSFHMQDARNHFHRVSESAFSSHRKWMGIIASNDQTPDGHQTAYIKGATETVLSKCSTYITTEGTEATLDDARRTSVLKAAETMAETGLRVIAFARSHSSTASPIANTEAAYTNLTFAGLTGIMDPPRPEVAASISKLLRGGVKVMMITGDAESTATAIARQLGMPLNPRPGARTVLKGEDLDSMTDAQLTEAISATTIFARTSPEHKMKIVRALQARHEVVAMTGDGVNDAPALKMADIGVAMGRNGTDVAKEAADMILADDNFSTILGAIEEGKGIFYNIQNFLTFQLSTSVAALGLVLISTIFGLQNPLNPMQILWINILMDGPPAQSLGVEPVSPHIMSHPPRSRHARILTPPVLLRILLSALIIMSGTMYTYIREMSDGVVTRRDTTMTFTCFVLFDMFNALACRSDTKSYLLGEMEWAGNGMFNFAVGMSLLGQACVVYMPALQGVFQTEGLGGWDLAWLVGIGSLVWWVDEGRKIWRRRRSGGVGSYSASV